MLDLLKSVIRCMYLDCNVSVLLTVQRKYDVGFEFVLVRHWREVLKGLNHEDWFHLENTDHMNAICSFVGKLLHHKHLHLIRWGFPCGVMFLSLGYVFLAHRHRLSIYCCTSGPISNRVKCRPSYFKSAISLSLSFSLSLALSLSLFVYFMRVCWLRVGPLFKPLC